MATFKITSHFMPWEVDYAQQMFIQLKKSSYYLRKEDKIFVHMVLNNSSNIINWSESKLPRKFFIDKFIGNIKLLKDYNVSYTIYNNTELYGCLDACRETIQPDVDYYINISPDMYFGEDLLWYMTWAAQSIKNKYFVLTPQIPKMWDMTWDVITNENFMYHPYDKWNEVDIFEIRAKSKTLNEPKLTAINEFKFAGWFDLYNKAWYEELLPIRKDFNGYGPYDYYSMLCAQYAKNKGIDIQQWILKNKIIFEYSVGPLKEIGFSKYYKDMLALNSIPNQRQHFEQNMSKYIYEWKLKNNI